MLLTILNIVGLSANFAGALMMFLANSSVEYHVGQFPNGEDLLKMSKNKSNTRLFRVGMAVLSIGFLIQLLALIIPLRK